MRGLLKWELKLQSGALELLLLLPKFPSEPPKRNGVPCCGVKRGRLMLPDCPGVMAFLFSSPNSLRLYSKLIALSTNFWKDGKVWDIS